MKCDNPITLGAGRAFGCGQCMPCRFNRRRVWTHRIMLEAAQYADNSFVTLTYSEEKLPRDANGMATLVPKHFQDWLKRLRASVSPLKFRFYGCGEYGDQTWRPHYHAALFGYPTCKYSRSQYSAGRRSCCESCDRVRDTWGFGLVDVGTLTTDSAQYVAGYVTKKMTKEDDPRLNLAPAGSYCSSPRICRHPEFARQSRRPGIGVPALPEIASTLMEFNLDTSQSDVPVTLRHGSRQLPLGRTLRRKLREQIGKEENAPKETIDALTEEMRPLWEDTKAAHQASETKIPGALDFKFKEAVLKATEGKRVRFHARARIFKKRGSI